MFSQMPFRFTEIAKVLLDVYVFDTFTVRAPLNRTTRSAITARLTTSRIRTSFAPSSKTFERHDRLKAEKVYGYSTTMLFRWVF